MLSLSLIILFDREDGENMQYREFGKTGKRISALGFGAMRLPKRADGAFDHEEGVRIIRKGFDLGINYIDTAPYYCDKESEIIVGKALKGYRDKVMLSTKNPIENDSPADFRKRLENSLKNLDVDCIDFYHLWGISWDAFEKDIQPKLLSEIDKVKDEGLIRNISFSFHDKAENMAKIIDAYPFASVLCQYNLLDRSNEDAIQNAHEKGLGVVIMGPVGGGRLGFPSEAIQSLLPGGVSSSPEIALRFVLAHPGVSCALSGMSNREQVEQNAQILSNTQPLSEAERAQVEAALAENKKRAELYCTGCNYCMPCPSGVGIPQIFEIMNYHRIYNLTDFAKGRYAEIGTGNNKNKNASACIDCGLCEEKCPQKIKIREQLRETEKVLA